MTRPKPSDPKPCTCGATYAALNTGLTFAEVKRMLWRGEDEAWRNKRRHGVLGASTSCSFGRQRTAGANRRRGTRVASV